MVNKFNSLANKKDYEDFRKNLIESAKGYGDIEEISMDDGYEIMRIVINPHGERTAIFVSGIHGDEPGGPYGILKFLRDKIKIPDDKRVIIMPIANPSGFELKTRENKDRIDINRNFMKNKLEGECKCLWEMLQNDEAEVFHTLHEDPDLKSFYCYYSHHKQIAEDIKELARKFFPIFNRETRKPVEGELYGDKVVDGLIPLPHVVRGTIEDKILLEKNIPYITTESPGKHPLSRRAKFNCDVMKLVIHAF